MVRDKRGCVDARVGSGLGIKPSMGRRSKKRKTANSSWLGPPVKVEGARSFYEKLVHFGLELSVGDAISVLLEDGGANRALDKTSVGVIESMSQIRGKGKKIEIRWYLFPEEVRNRIKGLTFGEDELYESNQVDECPVDAINSKVNIYASEDDANNDTSGLDCFFVQKFYDDELHILRPCFRDRRHRNRLGSGTGFSDTEGDDDLFSTACKKLHLSAVPSTLPCREMERAEIYNFLENAITNQSVGSSLYISGMPGTGKTATVHEVVRNLESNKTTPEFEFLEINALKLAHPYHVYTSLYKQITGEQVPQKRAAQLLEKLYSSPGPNSRPVLVVLLDELDYMLTQKQGVLYNLFDWPTRRNSKLVVIGIANTMNLPERLLPRIASRIGMGRVVFKSYTSKQIEEILQARLRGLGVFEDGATTMCAKKIATLSGDIRAALQLCRIAVRICQSEGEQKVSIVHVNKAEKKAKADVCSKAIRTASSIEKVLLVCLYNYLGSQNLEECTLDCIWNKLRNTWSQWTANQRVPNKDLEKTHVIHVCQRMGTSQLLHVKQSDYQRVPVIRIQTELESIKISLATDPVAFLFR